MKDFRLTKHFRLKEFVTTTLIPDYSPELTQEVVSRLTLTAVGLEMIRNKVNAPIHITQGYRTELLEKLMIKHGYNPSPTSQHKKGEAADIYVIGWPILKVFDVCKELFESTNWFSQIRCYPKMGIIHVGVNPPDRHIRRYCKIVE